jgi:hypothetical protein
MCVKLVIYKNYTEMQGQQNIIITSGVAQRFYLFSFVCLRTFPLITALTLCQSVA